MTQIESQTAIDTRPWCYATMIDSFSYRFTTNDTCRHPGFSGIVEKQEASYGTFWAARATGNESDNWTACGATPQEATRAAIAIWASLREVAA